mmetsp:Transcript_654/g.1371  ORF Transcript_654/g.1371 Transcript_654/m.1371 type:complete len:387 (+) Transcript_654:678-1838(+)
MRRGRVVPRDRAGRASSFAAFLKTLTLLNQSYFMSLFFFVSGYFVEPSYKKGWIGFRRGKCKRILLPAMFVTYIVSPCAILIAGTTTAYIPNPGPAWFLYWLLLFDLAYVSFDDGGPSCSASSSDARAGDIVVQDEYSTITTSAAMVETLVSNEPEDPAMEEREPISVEAQSKKLPSTCRRMALGIGVCGFGMLPLLILVQGTFASMPVATGSLLCDFVMFAVGLQARRGGWFERSLASQMDISPCVLAVIVFVEGAILTATGLLFEEHNELGLPLVLTAGVFCLDASLLLLLVFQRWMDFETRLTRCLARGAYGVYLLHPVVVTGITALFVLVFGTSTDGDEGEGRGLDPYLYPIGFVVVTVTSHLVNWPIAYCLAQAPYLKGIL